MASEPKVESAAHSGADHGHHNAGGGHAGGGHGHHDAVGGHAGADHGHHDAGGGHSGADHGHSSARHHTSGAPEHAHPDAAERASGPHDPPTPMHDHGDCPHCPAPLGEQRGASPAHVACDAVQSAADTARSAAPAKGDLKHTLAPLAWLVSLPAAPPKHALEPAAQSPPASPRLPLNLRYCVFLI
jgi:hypothetical protein